MLLRVVFTVCQLFLNFSIAPFLQIFIDFFVNLRCSVDRGTTILSPSNAIHTFEWELVIGRFFDDSDGIKIICEVSICNNVPFANLDQECRRCGQTSNKRKRRDVEDGKNKITRETTTRIFYIIEKRTPFFLPFNFVIFQNIWMPIEASVKFSHNEKIPPDIHPGNKKSKIWTILKSPTCPKVFFGQTERH